VKNESQRVKNLWPSSHCLPFFFISSLTSNTSEWFRLGQDSERTRSRAWRNVRTRILGNCLRRKWQMWTKKTEECGWTPYLYRCVTRLSFIHCFKDCTQTPWDTGSVSATALRQPPSQPVLGTRAADVTSAVIGNGDNSRESWGMGQRLCDPPLPCPGPALPVACFLCSPLDSYWTDGQFSRFL
jgi:hypothetical protein